MGFEYDVLGLATVLRAKENMPEYAEVGDGGLGGRILNDFNAEMALVYCVLVGVLGGDQ